MQQTLEIRIESGALDMNYFAHFHEKMENLRAQKKTLNGTNSLKIWAALQNEVLSFQEKVEAAYCARGGRTDASESWWNDPSTRAIRTLYNDVCKTQKAYVNAIATQQKNATDPQQTSHSTSAQPVSLVTQTFGYLGQRVNPLFGSLGYGIRLSVSGAGRWFGKTTCNGISAMHNYFRPKQPAYAA